MSDEIKKLSERISLLAVRIAREILAVSESSGLSYDKIVNALGFVPASSIDVDEVRGDITDLHGDIGLLRGDIDLKIDKTNGYSFGVLHVESMPDMSELKGIEIGHSENAGQIYKQIDLNALYIVAKKGANGSYICLRDENSDGSFGICARKGSMAALEGFPTGEILWKKIRLSAFAFPSSKYVNLTLPATGGTVTAPSDGWIQINKSSTAAGQYIVLQSSNGTRREIWSPGANQYHVVSIPVTKGDVITISYTFAGTTHLFRFFYSNGSTWEAS